MQRLLLVIPLGACIALGSCRHSAPKDPEPSPSAEEHLGRTTYRILSHNQFFILAYELPPEPADTIGLRVEVRGVNKMRLVHREDAVTSPPGDAEGLLGTPCKRVDVRLKEPIPAGQAISPCLSVHLDAIPATGVRIAITPLLMRDPGEEPPFIDPDNGLSTASANIKIVDGKEQREVIHSYNYRGWTLDPHPHASLTIPIDAPLVHDVALEDLLPDGTAGVRVEVIGFRIAILRVDPYDTRIQDATADVTLDAPQGYGCYTSPSGMADVTIQFAGPVDADSAGVVRMTASPMDRKVPIKGLLRFTYLTESR